VWLTFCYILVNGGGPMNESEDACNALSSAMICEAMGFEGTAEALRLMAIGVQGASQHCQFGKYLVGIEAGTFGRRQLAGEGRSCGR
jgi:hypothetical protein